MKSGGIVERTKQRLFEAPCPECGSWDLIGQSPIDVDIDVSDARKALGQYARAKKTGATPLKGPCFIMCKDCGHKGPAVDCAGRTSEDVGADPAVFTEMKRLWVGDREKLSVARSADIGKE